MEERGLICIRTGTNDR